MHEKMAQLQLIWFLCKEVANGRIDQAVQAEAPENQTASMRCHICYNDLELENFNCLVPCGHFCCRVVS